MTKLGNSLRNFLQPPVTSFFFKTKHSLVCFRPSSISTSLCLRVKAAAATLGQLPGNCCFLSVRNETAKYTGQTEAFTTGQSRTSSSERKQASQHRHNVNYTFSFLPKELPHHPHSKKKLITRAIL